MSSVITDDLGRDQGGDRRRGGGRPDQEEARRPFFWICVGWIVARRRPGHHRQPAPAAQPRPRELQQRAERGPGLGPPPRHRRPLPRHLQPAHLRRPGLARGRLRRRAHRPHPRRHPRHDLGLPAGAGRHGPQHGLLRRARLPRHRGRHRHRVLLGHSRCGRSPCHRPLRGAPHLPGRAGLDALVRHPRLRAGRQGARRQRHAHPDPRDPAQHHADHRLVRPDRGGHHHRAGGHPGLPRPLRAAPDARAGATCSTRGRSLLTGAKGQTNPWLVIFPASAMFLLLISLNVVADKLRAYFDVAEIKL